MSLQSCFTWVWVLAIAVSVDSWKDPHLDEFLQGSPLIVHVKASDFEKGQFEVLDTLIGDNQDKKTLQARIAQDRHAEKKETPKDSEWILYLSRGENGLWETATPTFGLFEVSEGMARRIIVRDTFTKVDVSLKTFKSWIRLVHAGRNGQKTDGEALRSFVDSFKETDPQTKTLGDVQAQVLGLEALSAVGSEPYADLASRFLSSPYRQVRWSASRALATCGGEKAMATLAGLLKDKDAGLIHFAAQGLGRHRVRGMVAPLVQAVGTAATEGATLRSNLMDPRMNWYPSPQSTILWAINQITAQSFKKAEEVAPWWEKNKGQYEK